MLVSTFSPHVSQPDIVAILKFSLPTIKVFMNAIPSLAHRLVIVLNQIVRLVPLLEIQKQTLEVKLLIINKFVHILVQSLPELIYLGALCYCFRFKFLFGSLAVRGDFRHTLIDGSFYIGDPCLQIYFARSLNFAKNVWRILTRN